MEEKGKQEKFEHRISKYQREYEGKVQNRMYKKYFVDNLKFCSEIDRWQGVR